jgi:predicted chitinase
MNFTDAVTVAGTTRRNDGYLVADGLAPIWYWDTHNLNRWADQGDSETIAKKIIGGINGLTDRIDHYVRCG